MIKIIKDFEFDINFSFDCKNMSFKYYGETFNLKLKGKRFYMKKLKELKFYRVERNLNNYLIGFYNEWLINEKLKNLLKD